MNEVDKRPERESRSSSEARSWARQLTAYGNVGMMFPVSIAIGFLGGRWLDGYMGTSPWLSLGGFGLGVAAALRHLIRMTGRLQDGDSE